MILEKFRGVNTPLNQSKKEQFLKEAISNHNLRGNIFWKLTELCLTLSKKTMSFNSLFSKHMQIEGEKVTIL